jgi:hypothetical protein
MTRADHDTRDMLPVVRAADIVEHDAGPRWLVQALWARAGVGILGGAPKCCKSWLALELALSVTSNTSCLGELVVGDPGPALLYMAEDAAPVVKSRLAGICRHRGLLLADQDLHLITAPVLRLDREQDQARLRQTVARHAPRLLVLDPFVRLHRIDENDAGQVSALLGFLRELQRAYDVAIIVVHHARKNGSAAQPGQSLRGSGDFFAWADSLLYMRRQREKLLLTVEHRAAPAPDPVALTLVGDDDNVHLEIVTDDDDHRATNVERDPSALDRAILDALTVARQPLPRADLRARLRVRNERLGQALTRLASSGAVKRHGDRWAVPDSNHP